MEEERKPNVMSVELAIQRELAYRKKIASFLSEEELAELLPLKAPNKTIDPDQASQMELDGWKLVRIEELEQGTPYPISSNDQAPLLALEGPKSEKQAEKGEMVPPIKSNQASQMALKGPKVAMQAEVPSSANKSDQAPRKALESLKLEMCGKKEERVPSSNTLRNPYPTSTHFVGQCSKPLTKPSNRPHSVSIRTAVPLPEVPVSVPNPKPSSVPHENQRASNPGPSDPICLPNQPLHSRFLGNGAQSFCLICKLDCSSPFNYKKHFRGRKHRAKLQYMGLSGNAGDDGKKKKKHPRCDLCEIFCSDENNLQLHFSGKKHKAKMQDVQLGQKRKSSQQHWCDLCQVPCPNAEVYELHLKGKNHAAILFALAEKRRAI